MDVCCVSGLVLVIALAAGIYLIVRYASIYNYVHLDLDEWTILSHAYRDAGPQDAQLPAGRPVYRLWPMSYHRIFANGIYTDIGNVDVATVPRATEDRIAKVRLKLSPGFVPFDRVVGIYDITLLEQSKGSPGKAVRTATKVGLQVETRDFRTAILSAPNFDVPRARAVLERAMGPGRELRYRPEEVLAGVKVGDHHYRDAHMHKLLRHMPWYGLKREEAMEKAGVGK